MVLKTREEAKAFILNKATQDAAFQKKLIADPRAVVSAELGVELPDWFRINILQESDQDVFLVLPAPIAASGQLADAQLDAVVGGAMAAQQGGCEKAYFDKGVAVQNPAQNPALNPATGPAMPNMGPTF